VSRKTFGKRGHGRRSSHSLTQTSSQELALAKPLKHSTIFAAKSSELSPAEKASVAGIESARKKMSSTSTTRSGMIRAPKHALNLFDFVSSA
jgi:hypothetical protein